MSLRSLSWGPHPPLAHRPISGQPRAIDLSYAVGVLVSCPFSGLFYWVDLGVAFLLDELLGRTWWTTSVAMLYCILPRSPLSARGAGENMKYF